MTCRRPYRTDGSLLVDAAVAIAVFAAAVATIASLDASAADALSRADGLRAAIEGYLSVRDGLSALMPGDSISRSTQIGSNAVQISASARRYGNDRIEVDATSTSPAASVSFVAIRSRYPAPADDAAGASLCAADDEGVASVVPIILPMDPRTPLTSLVVRGRHAYVAADSSERSAADMVVLDIDDPSAPRILAALDTGPGIRGLAVAGRMIFAAAASSVAQLQAVSYDGSSALTLISTLRLPLPTASSSSPIGSAVAYSRGYAYLGTERWDGPELSIIDASDPSDMRVVGSVEIGGKVSAISVDDGIAYLASSGAVQFAAVDVRDPRRPALIASFGPNGWTRQDGRSATAFESAAVFGRTTGGFDIRADHELFAWSGDGALGPSVDIPGGAYGIVVDRSHVVVGGRAFDQEISVYDRSLSSSTASYLPLPVGVASLACDLGTIYALAGTAPAIYRIRLKPSWPRDIR